ncbi:hypothetical protein A3770_12p66790 [Chloropicon primus]|uniref:Uncharacterized protein n=1 Tax=Chloropicon primus TaxID=1764295 RepID=A0A5B8MV14_9CHLO|nr:hypothetical protein A3770_12p66790 [Chloropicon primus]|eukprot:QDZ24161.1 hypothetical protein A3770_12p66790 [Chloropicon primus]
MRSMNSLGSLGSGRNAGGPPSVSTFRKYQSEVLNSQAATVSTSAQDSSVSQLSFQPGTETFLPVLRDAPKGLEVCSNAVFKFADFYTRLTGLKIGTLAGFKENLAKKGSSLEQVNEALSAKLQHFPRSYTSYCNQINRLAKLGRQFPEAMTFALISMLPRSSGLAKQLTGYDTEMSSMPWMHQLQGSISFGSMVSKVKAKLPRNCDSLLELLGHLVELAVADAMHAFLSREVKLSAEVSDWVIKLCAYMICKHPAWCMPGSWHCVHRYPFSKPESKIFTPVPNKNAARVFRPVEVSFALTRSFVFEQWSSVLGLVSVDYLEEVVDHMLNLAQRTSHDPLSVVLLAGCRYIRWSVSTPEEVNCVRTFLRFVIAQLDSHRDMPERNLHISTIDSVVSRLDFTNVYKNQDVISLFQVEVNQVYTMCIRWSKQEELKDASYLLLANIFARCPSSFLVKSHNFIAKRLIGPFTTLERSRRCIEAHTQILRGCHNATNTGWLPEASKFRHWSSQFVSWGTDGYSTFQNVPRADETRETRIGRVMQICEAMYFKSQLNGGLKLEMQLVNSMVLLLLQCTSSAFDYMTAIVLPAMLGEGTMHRKENDSKEWKLAALITLRVIMDSNSNFVHYARESIAREQDEEHNHITFAEFFQEVLSSYTSMVRGVVKLTAKNVPQSSLLIFPHIQVSSQTDMEVLDDRIDIAPELVAAARHSISICKEALEERSEHLSNYVKTKVAKQDEGRGGVTKNVSESLWLANRIRLRNIESHGQGGFRKLQEDAKVSRETTRSRLQAEYVSMLAFLDPNYLCGLEAGAESSIQISLFAQDSILLKNASLAVQDVAESLPSRIPDLLALICKKASSTVFSSVHQITFSLGHVGHLIEQWLHHLGAKSDLPSVMLSESLQPLHMVEAWALASLCHSDEGIRICAFRILQLTGKIGEVLQNLKGGGEGEGAGKNLVPKSQFSSCSSIFLGDALIDKAFYRASTDYAELDGIHLPSLRSDAGTILQPTVAGLVTSKHTGKCWPKVSRISKGIERTMQSKASEVELTKSELHLNLILEIGEAICDQKKYQPTLIELWQILKEGLNRMPSLTNAMKEEASGNTLVTTMCFFFAVASCAREEESSELGAQHALHYGEKKEVIIERPSQWSAVIEEDGAVRNVGTSPMDEDHLSQALHKWSCYCSETDMKNAASTLRFGSLMDQDINFEQVRKWIENKRSRKYDKAQRIPIAEDVRKRIISFMSSKSILSNVLKSDHNMKEIVYKSVKSAHWSSMITVVQCLIAWYEETSTSMKTGILLELITYLLTSHNIHLSMQYSDNMLDCVLTVISALEQDLEKLIIGEDRKAGQEVVISSDKIDCIFKHHKLIEQHASLLCFLSSTFKKLYGSQEDLWPARKRKQSLMFLSRVSAIMVEILGRENTDNQMEDKKERIEALVNPVALALNEVVSVCSVDDIEREVRFPKAFEKMNHHLSFTLRLLLDSRKPGFKLDSSIRACINSKKSARHFNALYHYILVSSSRLTGPIEFEDLDSHCVKNIIEHSPTLIMACIREIFRDNAETFGNATKFLIVIAAVLNVTYSDNHDNLEFQATMAMLHGLHHSFSSTKDAYSVDVIKRIAGICTMVSVEVISEACLLLKASLGRGEDTLWILKTLSYWCEPIDTVMLNRAKVDIPETPGDGKEIHSKRMTSSVILSELCSLTVGIYSRGGLSSSIHLAGMVEVWESLCYSHGEFNNSSMIEITTFLMQKSIGGVVSRPLLRRILDTLCKNLQDQMISVLSTSTLKSLELTLNEGAGSRLNQNALSISGLSAMSLSNIFQGMTSFPSKVKYSKLFVASLLMLDSSNDLLRNGMRSLLSSLMSQIKSGRDREPLSDVILKLCNVASDASHGKILEWSSISDEEYPNRDLRATIRACTVYLSGLSNNFDIELGESALDIALSAKNDSLSGRAFEIVACLDCYGKMNMADVCKVMPVMARIFKEKGNHLLGLNKESSTLLQSQETLSSKSLYLCRQVCRFLHGLIAHTSKVDSEKGDLVIYFWITIAIMRCKIRPIYIHCLDLLAGVFSNKGDAYLSAYARNQTKFFWEFCEEWNPKMDGVGQLLLWGTMQDNFPLYVRSLQLFLHGSALTSEDIFHRAQMMQKGDITGTKVFKSAIAVVWLNLVLEENAVPKHASINKHLGFQTFVQLEFFKAKSMVALGEGVTKEWQPFVDVLILGSKGNFANEPHRFLTACARNLGAGLAKRDLLELGEVLTALACKGSKHLRLPVLKMVLVLISQPDKYFASELMEKFFPLMERAFDGEEDYESNEVLGRIKKVITQSNAWRMLQGGLVTLGSFEFFDRVITENGASKLRAALSATIATQTRLDDYNLARDANKSGWDTLFSTGPLLNISEKLARTGKGKGPTHQKKKAEEESFIEQDFLKEFESILKPQAIHGTFLSEEKDSSAKKGLGDFFMDIQSPMGGKPKGPIKVGSKVRRKKTKKPSGGPPPPPPLEVLQATTTTKPARDQPGDDSVSDNYSTDEYYSEDSYSYSYSYSESESESETDLTRSDDDMSSSYDYSSSYSTSTSNLSYSSAD